MHKYEVNRLLADLRDEMLDTDEGVSGARLAARFDTEYPYVRDEMASVLYDEWLRSKADSIAKPPRTAQEHLPGLGDVPKTVTTFDAEGGFIYKRLWRGSVADLENDLQIQTVNADAAVAARRVAEQRNHLLVPIMVEHGFATAGEAISWLEAQP